MLQFWQVLHYFPAILRWPIKLVLAVAASALILFPKIWLLPVEIERMSNVEVLIEPNHPLLAPLAAEVKAEIDASSLVASSPAASSPGEASLVASSPGKLASDETAPDETAPDEDANVPQPLTIRQAVEQVVYRHVPYAFDWEIWGVMQYTPTLDEVFAAGREDCDGRAIVAASLLRRLGVQAWIVTDLQHCWVRTPEGDAMNPGKGEATVKQDGVGAPTRVVLSWAMVENLARGTAWGIGVFPLTRLLCFYLVFVGLTVHPWSGINRRLLGAGIALLALGLLREGGVAMLARNESNWLVWSGVAVAVAGWLVLAVKADVTPQRKPASESPARSDASPG